MIGKQTKGTSFGGCVSYVFKEEKARLLEAVGVDGSPEQMAEQFELQSLLNDKVKNIVGHTSLSFSPQDSLRLQSDDALMLKIAHEYMERIGIRNTQYIIARHIDREHPHCHIVFNRVDNDGKTISDKNDRYRNEKVCKMLTAKYRLHFANGKDCVKEERLRPYDRAKHEIYKALKAEVPYAQSWNELKDALATRGVDIKFKVSRTTREIQGVKFTYGDYTISGSKISREFSYLAIDRQLERNAYAPSYPYRQAIRANHAPPPPVQERTVEWEESHSSGLGLLTPSPTSNTADEAAFEAELKRKKKAKRKRGFRR